MVRIGGEARLEAGLTATDVTLACMKQAYDSGINFFDTAER
jgi:aryl-alcohol dehydrogenase-like predicted oxidoreductase